MPNFSQAQRASRGFLISHQIHPSIIQQEWGDRDVLQPLAGLAKADKTQNDEVLIFSLPQENPAGDFYIVIKIAIFLLGDRIRS